MANHNAKYMLKRWGAWRRSRFIGLDYPNSSTITKFLDGAGVSGKKPEIIVKTDKVAERVEYTIMRLVSKNQLSFWLLRLRYEFNWSVKKILKVVGIEYYLYRDIHNSIMNNL